MMPKVKTFTSELKILHTMAERQDLDQQVNNFIDENNIKNVVSVNDACITDNNGATIGIIRIIAYEA
ncbi:MAG TPA: hypothetical protein ENI15_20360 [Spirochaetes bacterium]|nr:hypothetical protein [Spirochaetota bacterium]